MNKKRFKLLITFSLFFAIIVTISMTISSATKDLLAMGYSQKQASEIVSINNVNSIVENTKQDLDNTFAIKRSYLSYLGVNKSSLVIDQPIYSSIQMADTLITNRINELENDNNQLEKLAKEYRIKINTTSNNIYEYNKYLNKLVSGKQEALIKNYSNKLIELEFDKQIIEEMISPDKDKSLKLIKDAYNKELKRIEKLDGFTSTQLQAQAMRMFNITNKYRKSLGLKEYSYNYEQQACTFKEAKAYANTNTPHNWACKSVANENAAIASVNSDYVATAMNFFKTDPPHEAVLSGNYKTMSIAFVVNNNQVYMIMAVF